MGNVAKFVGLTTDSCLLELRVKILPDLIILYIHLLWITRLLGTRKNNIIC
jgi:hypothetical protein